MIPMREMKIKLLMLMKLEKCRNELGWLVRYEECVVNNCPEEDFPPMPLPVPPDYTKIFGEESGNGQKGYIATFLQDGSKQALPTTSTSIVRSSTPSGNFIMLAITNAVH